jgi:hypothetical protein
LQATWPLPYVSGFKISSCLKAETLGTINDLQQDSKVFEQDLQSQQNQYEASGERRFPLIFNSELPPYRNAPKRE